jgi:hypothetical protein
MTGWQRIGVVISVLWLIGVPVYLVVISGDREMYEQCIEQRLPNMTRQQKRDLCWKSFHPPWKEVGYTLIAWQLRHHCFIVYDVRANRDLLVSREHHPSPDTVDKPRICT